MLRNNISDEHIILMKSDIKITALKQPRPYFRNECSFSLSLSEISPYSLRITATMFLPVIQILLAEQ